MPHFEKMLYDNPQLALTYLDAFRVTLARQRGSSSSSAPAATAAADAGAALASPIADGGQAGTSSSGAAGDSGVSTADEVLYDPRAYATVVRGVLDYLRRDMTHPDGGLYSAEVGGLHCPAVCHNLPDTAVLVLVVLNMCSNTSAKAATRGCFGTCDAAFKPTTQQNKY